MVGLATYGRDPVEARASLQGYRDVMERLAHILPTKTQIVLVLMWLNFIGLFNFSQLP